MISHTTERFWKAYRALPSDIRKQARKAYRLFQQDPYHPSLHFKRIHATKPLYSIRISRDYRPLCVRDEDTIIWLWIGSHAEYDKMLGSL